MASLPGGVDGMIQFLHVLSGVVEVVVFVIGHRAAVFPRHDGVGCESPGGGVPVWERRGGAVQRR